MIADATGESLTSTVGMTFTSHQGRKKALSWSHEGSQPHVTWVCGSASLCQLFAPTYVMQAGICRWMYKEDLRKYVLSILTKGSFRYKWRQNVGKPNCIEKQLGETLNACFRPNIYCTSCPVSLPRWLLLFEYEPFVGAPCQTTSEVIFEGLLTWTHWLLLITFKCHLHKHKLFYIKWHHWEILALLKYFISLDGHHVSQWEPMTFQILISECICVIKKEWKNGDRRWAKNGRGGI